MNYLYFDGASGLSGDMILGALLDLGAPRDEFLQRIKELNLPVSLKIQDTQRASLRGLKVDVEIALHSHGRRFADIEGLITASPLPEKVKGQALSIFLRLFEAEAKVHGRDIHKTHLHEAGADDALVDIVGTCLLLDMLQVERIHASPLNVGSGWVKAAHGVLPVPPPAVGELLKGVPVYSAWAEKELVTPTGAAIITTLAEGFIPLPQITYSAIGYGAGGFDFPEFSNILRVFYGPAADFPAGKPMMQIEAHIDDSNPQVLAAFLDKALEMGAADAALTPIVMKKNRLATKLTILTAVDKMEDLIRAVFSETTSIGIRYFPVGRRVLGRRMEKVTVLDQEIAVKVATLAEKDVNVQPEFSDCLKAAEKTGAPLKDIIDLAKSAFKDGGR
jgi:uncharacterized protein (TIGR00299 family) protein